MRFGNRTENELKTGVIFYCKDCEKIVKVMPVGRKFVYRCNICKTKNVAFGTEKSIRNFYRLPDDLPLAEGVDLKQPAAIKPADNPVQEKVISKA